MKTYRTAKIAALVGVHPNTVRFYEDQGLLPPIPRQENGYRIYTEAHLLQLRFIRLAFKAEILSGTLRDEVIDIVKTAAGGDYDRAVQGAARYRVHIGEEMEKAREAILLTKRLMDGAPPDEDPVAAVGRWEAAGQIGVSVDVLRDWERNGLIQIPRRGRLRQYGQPEMNRLKIIALLRHAHYSQASIRRMFQKLDQGETDFLSSIDTPEAAEDIVSVADRYITSLSGALEDSGKMLELLEKMKTKKETLQ